VTFPSSDTGFRLHVESVARSPEMDAPEALEHRLRGIYPRVRVRPRELSSEAPVWYVYRDGAWRPPDDGDGWWRDRRVGRLELTSDGWIVDGNPLALGLLGLTRADIGDRHVSDFVTPGTLSDMSTLFEIIVSGERLSATLRVRPTSGEVLALDIVAQLEGNRVVAALRLADDVDVDPHVSVPLPTLLIRPEGDALFAGYVARVAARIPEPTPDGLELRLHRLYPHASVVADGDGWRVQRDGETGAGQQDWWLVEGLPTVRYDAQGLILDANEAALALLGRDVVGRHWQDLVTPGSTTQVTPVIEMLREAGHALSRFRMPDHEGTLVEFDSYSAVDGDVFTTIMRPLGAVPVGRPEDRPTG
jgi:PAS domain-containing protein